MATEYITKNLTKAEIACKDGCGFATIAPELAEGFQRARDMAGEAIFITSGCRCPKRNKYVGGVADSAHLTGKALDLHFKCTDYFSMVKLAFLLGRSGFKRLGVSDKFLHVDTDTSKPECVFRY